MQEVSDPVVAANMVLQPHQCCACPVFQDKNPARFSSLSSVTHEVTGWRVMLLASHEISHQTASDPEGYASCYTHSS